MRGRLRLLLCVAALSAGCGTDTEDSRPQSAEPSTASTTEATTPAEARNPTPVRAGASDHYWLRLNTIFMCDAIRASVSEDVAGIGPDTAPALIAQSVIESTEVSIERLRTLRPPAKYREAHQALISAKGAIVRTNEELVRNPPVPGEVGPQRAARKANQLLFNALRSFPGRPPDPLTQGARREYMDAQCRDDANHDDAQREYVDRVLRVDVRSRRR